MKLSILVSAAIVAQSALAATIFVTPTNQTITLGSPATVNVSISDLGDGAAPSVGTYDLDISFDPTHLSFDSIAWGTGLDVLGLGTIQSAVPSLSTINVFELSLDAVDDLNSLQASSFRLFTLNFLAVGVGDSPITISVNALGDADGVAIPFMLNDGSVTVSNDAGNSVPEPSQFLPAGIALTALVILKARRERPQESTSH